MEYLDKLFRCYGQGRPPFSILQCANSLIDGKSYEGSLGEIPLTNVEKTRPPDHAFAGN
jgi:hypothetical protein